jgi:hypothetical protein
LNLLISLGILQAARLYILIFDKLYSINNDGSGLTKIYQTPNGKFGLECDWSNDTK